MQNDPLTITGYQGEEQLPDIIRLIEHDLSEPYSIYTYRYFLHQWPNLCFLAKILGTESPIAVIICKMEERRRHDLPIKQRGYIAMLAVKKEHRKAGIGTRLVKTAIDAMIAQGADEIVLETERTNEGAMNLYQNLGFIRDKRLFRYYLNGIDAFRFILLVRNAKYPKQLRT